MKLRIRDNSLRLRLNRREVNGLVSGNRLEERLQFPGDTCITYVLESSRDGCPNASFTANVIHISAPVSTVTDWAQSETIGIYFELPANGMRLKVAIEKDLECVDAPIDDRDPDAFPRTGKSC